jgi:glycosyltransferase involved in cell wall biosynthesis
MHAGVPVVAYRDAALPELVRDGGEGILVEPGDIPGLAAALGQLAGDPALRTRMGSIGRLRAQLFRHERFVKEVSDLYHELLENAR